MLSGSVIRVVAVDGNLGISCERCGGYKEVPAIILLAQLCTASEVCRGQVRHAVRLAGQWVGGRGWRASGRPSQIRLRLQRHDRSTPKLRRITLASQGSPPEAYARDLDSSTALNAARDPQPLLVFRCFRLDNKIQRSPTFDST
jgi:hypothetical protein